METVENFTEINNQNVKLYRQDVLRLAQTPVKVVEMVEVETTIQLNQKLLFYQLNGDVEHHLKDMTK
jgi:hypothetical protein